MEAFLLKTYRRLVPGLLKRVLSAGLKERLFEALLYLGSRPQLEDLRLTSRARAAERRGDWAAAETLWQALLLRHLPETAPDDPEGRPVTQQPAATEGGAGGSQQQLRHAAARLRRARARRALALYAAGQQRAADELVCRVVESLPDHRLLKVEPTILDAASTYIRRALVADGALPRRSAAAAGPPRRIAVCLDILKVSEVHTHARMIFAICRNLMRLDPGIETHLVITRERFAVTTPVVSPSFGPGREAEIAAMARAAMGDAPDGRFRLHLHEGHGLEGVVRTCASILALEPDLILYGGGHRGLYSNESRLVRHVLYPDFPTVFFYIQSNNQVDPRLDLIIARGPHAIHGDPGGARIRVQPYPTVADANPAEAAPAFDPQRLDRPLIVSAITGVRLNQQLSQADPAMLERLFALLDAVPGAHWQFIGAADPEAAARDIPAVRRRVAAGQMTILPVLPFDEFRACLVRAALFVHPPGFTGGSGGAAVARAAGVPILTCRNSDVSGRQPPETVFDAGDMRGLVRLAARLLTDPDAWQATVRRQFEHTAWIRETSAQGFYACLAEAGEAFLRRAAAAGPAR